MVVYGNQVVLQDEEERAVDVDRLPDEPRIQGGILSPSPKNQLEPQDLESLPFDTSPVQGNGAEPLYFGRMLITAQFLVDDALHILSSFSQSRPQSDTTSSSIFLRLLRKLLDFIKSLSFLQYTSQEEPLSSSTDPKADNLAKVMELLSKAAKADNADAMYLLGELNFVPSVPL